MEQGTDIRSLEEWIYAIHTALADLEKEAPEDALTPLRKTLDAMREHCAHLKLRRHNETGY